MMYTIEPTDAPSAATATPIARNIPNLYGTNNAGNATMFASTHHRKNERSILGLIAAMFSMNKTLTSLNSVAANGVRYPRVGGAKSRHFAGASLKPRKLPENA